MFFPLRRKVVEADFTGEEFALGEASLGEVKESRRRFFAVGDSADGLALRPAILSTGLDKLVGLSRRAAEVGMGRGESIGCCRTDADIGFGRSSEGA